NVWDRVKGVRSFSPFPAAERALAEFGNLKYLRRSYRFSLDPTLGEPIAEQIHNLERKIGRRLYPVGTLYGGGFSWILIDEDGRVYTFNVVLNPMASSFDRAVRYLVSGKISRQDQEEDLRSIEMLGKVWELDPAPLGSIPSPSLVASSTPLPSASARDPSRV